MTIKIDKTSLLVLLCVLGIIAIYSFTRNNEVSTCSQQQIHSLCRNKPFEFAGEKVPLDDPEVYERLDRELSVNAYWQSNTLLTLKLADKYFPIIEPILKEQGVPDDFKYLCMAESGLRDVISPAGASGKWQFMKGTAAEYNMKVTDEIDERYDIVKSTVAACQYFNSAKNKLGSWTSAAASYNMGINGFQNKVNEQIDDNYYNLWLNQETSRYVFRIIALKEIHKNPKNYGFYFEKEDNYPEIKSELKAYMLPIPDLSLFAKSYNTNYKTLRYLNPWIRSNKLTKSNEETIVLRMPVK